MPLQLDIAVWLQNRNIRCKRLFVNNNYYE